jgi:aminoglycoside/choline kinase family phosphotransferase
MILFDEKKAQEFLRKNNIKEASIQKIAGDASFRSYYRVFFGAESLILMFAPPSHEDILPFVKIAELLIKKDLRAPKIFAKDFENGFLLLEDFKDATFGRVLKNDKSEEFALYKKAVDCLIKLENVDFPENISQYNHALLFREVMIFVDWYLKIKLSVEQKMHFKKLCFALFDKLNFAEKYLVLRDYHADNLMKLDDGDVGLLDFQDAVIGSKAYDLVSLLEDARRDVDEDVAQKILRYYIENAKVDEASFLQDYAILSLQRNLKILGIFSRLAKRDQKDFYLSLIPRVKKLVLRRLVSDKILFGDIAQFLHKMI